MRLKRVVASVSDDNVVNYTDAKDSTSLNESGGKLAILHRWFGVTAGMIVDARNPNCCIIDRRAEYLSRMHQRGG